MPNHVYNRIDITGDKKQIKKFVSLVAKKPSEFDFNAVVPMPKELEGTSAPASILTKEEIKQKKKEYESLLAKEIQNKLFHAEKPSKYSFGITQEEHDKLKAKYGAVNWYDWNCQNWGTQWNAYEVSALDFSDNYANVGFSTAWSPPTEFFINASKKFPKLKFRNEYSGEGQICLGQYEIQNGQMLLDEEYEWYSSEGVDFRKSIGEYDEDSEYELEEHIEYLKEHPEDKYAKDIKKLKVKLKKLKI
jgi:hypothetical protein